MANAIIQLPYTATTSGNILDASLVTVGANAVRRERMVIVDDVNTTDFAAVVTTSGALSVARTPTSLTSGIITLSSVIGISSGLVTLSSNPVAGQVVALSSGLITFSSAPTVNISSGVITLSSNPVASQIISLSSGTVTLSSPTSLSSGIVNTLTSGVYLVNATSTSGLLVDVSRGVTLAFFNFRATSSGFTELVAVSGSNKVKLVSYVVVSNSTQGLSFYSSNTAIGGSSSAPMVLSSYSGISAQGDRTSWVLETSAAGNLRAHLDNAGILSGHGSYIYEV